ncbi:phage tail family protein [Staphylococcus nepalensis]|nr:phage tail domain-containing protein [Staphylococcus nepalensis]MCD8891007.1 phage tail family protein [Staphylococcus nepalensis]
MNKIDYPVGIKPLDFLVSSIEKERKSQSIDGIPGNVDYGFDYKDREVTLTFWLRHYHGEYDNRLMKSDLYNLLDSQPYFYISDDRLPSRVLKVTIDEQYMPERVMHSPFSELEVKGNVSGRPFWRTKYTTQDLQTHSYSGLVEKFGTTDGINIDRTKYTFTETTFKVWNGGNVTVDPRNMMLYIKMFYVKGTGSITNKTTGEKLNIINDWKGNHLTIEGVKIIKATNVNGLRDTNRKFISLVPGNNEIEIKGLEFTKISFDFPYYYK